MANYTVARSTHKTAGAAVEDVVRLPGKYDLVAVLHRSSDLTDELYFRTDGVAAVVGADNTDVLMPGQGEIVKPDSYENVTNANTFNTIVRLISTGAVKYTVRGIVGSP